VTISLPPAPTAPADCPVDGSGSGYRVGGVGGLGDPGTWLLAGPSAHQGREPLIAHLARLGLLPASGPGALSLLRSSGLRGRGGGGFPIAAKLETALSAPGDPLVIVNASESEPASRKDAVLVSHRPHLVLDGAAAVASILGAAEVVVHLHRGAVPVRSAVEQALAERRESGLGDPRWRLSTGPDRYVAGEASAIASLLAGGEARPVFSPVPMARMGPSGRPTVVNNAETMAHVGLLLRTGAQRWRSAGSPSSPGPQLLTLVGAVPDPGRVLELTGVTTIGEVLTAAGCTQIPAAVLIGGYGGTWVAGEAAWWTLFDRASLERVGAGPGCGLLGVLPQGACGLAESARLMTYLAGETAGQCRPCVLGLPQLATGLAALARGSCRRSGLRRLRARAAMVEGGGACSHPDAAVRFLRSALEVFEDDVNCHLTGRPCRGSDHAPVFPVPDTDCRRGGWK
jgi:NADH:ubiquinone oxidoreductase subunit F (NADH-binding)